MTRTHRQIVADLDRAKENVVDAIIEWQMRRANVRRLRSELRAFLRARKKAK